MTSGISSIQGPVVPLDPAALAHREAVAEAPRIYALGMDRRDEAMALSVFDPNALVTGMLGEDRAADYLPRLIKGLEPFASTMHSITNQYVVVEGDRAWVWSYCRAYHVYKEKGRPHCITTLVYKDELERTSRGWIITAREADHQWRDG